MLHDLVACTGMVYKWNASLASVRERTLKRARDEGVADIKADLNP